MENFEFCNPTKIIFGKGEVERAGQIAAGLGSRVLLVTGSKSAKKSGLLDRVIENLETAGLEVWLLEGVVPNPRLSKVHEGIELCRKNGVELVCALGGGSVMDTAKAIAAGVRLDVDIWEVFQAKAEITEALPIMTIPTLAASGSEMNGFMVITNEVSGHKLAAGSPHVYPKVSILDPELTFSVPRNHTAYGGVDAVCHLMEPYFNGPSPHTPVQDGLAESLMKTIMEATRGCLDTPDDYDSRADMMWAATLALNGLTRAGVGDHPFPVHLVEHAISAIFDVAHGAGLAALLPGWMAWRIGLGKGAKIAQFGRNVMGIAPSGEIEKEAREAAKAFAVWLRQIGAPANLAELGIKPEEHEKIAENALFQAGIWGITDLYSRQAMIELLSFCQSGL